LRTDHQRLLTDRIGGKRAMLIGAAGTIVTNVLFGRRRSGACCGCLPCCGIEWLPAIFWLTRIHQDKQFVFSEKQRGTFAGIFGFMINLGGSWPINCCRHCLPDSHSSGCGMFRPALALAFLDSGHRARL